MSEVVLSEFFQADALVLDGGEVGGLVDRLATDNSHSFLGIQGTTITLLHQTFIRRLRRFTQIFCSNLRESADKLLRFP